MSYDTERSLIEAHFKTEWDALNNGILVGWDEHDFEPPTNAQSVRITIGSGRADQISFGAPGSNLERHAGAILIQLFSPAGQGSNAIRELADIVAPIFRNKVLGNVITRIPSIENRQTDTAHLIWTMSVPFQRDEFQA